MTPQEKQMASRIAKSLIEKEETPKPTITLGVDGEFTLHTEEKLEKEVNIDRVTEFSEDTPVVYTYLREEDIEDEEIEYRDFTEVDSGRDLPIKSSFGLLVFRFFLMINPPYAFTRRLLKFVVIFGIMASAQLFQHWVIIPLILYGCGNSWYKVKVVELEEEILRRRQ